MKVAIIGGGFAGIVCATQLERLGITPDIFERNTDVAEPYRHVGAALQIVLRPIKDPLQYLSQNYNIDLRPSGLLKWLFIAPSFFASLFIRDTKFSVVPPFCSASAKAASFAEARNIA